MTFKKSHPDPGGTWLVVVVVGGLTVVGGVGQPGPERASVWWVVPGELVVGTSTVMR